MGMFNTVMGMGGCFPFGPSGSMAIPNMQLHSQDHVLLLQGQMSTLSSENQQLGWREHYVHK